MESIARDIYNESTPQKIINEIIAKHNNDFGISKIKEFRFNKKYIFIGIIFIGIYFKIVDKKDIYFIIATFFITIVFTEMLKSKK